MIDFSKDDFFTEAVSEMKESGTYKTHKYWNDSVMGAPDMIIKLINVNFSEGEERQRYIDEFKSISGYDNNIGDK